MEKAIAKAPSPILLKRRTQILLMRTHSSMATRIGYLGYHFLW